MNNVNVNTSINVNVNVNVAFITNITHGNVIFDILELAAFRKYSTDWVLQKFEEPCRMCKKYINVNVNVI